MFRAALHVLKLDWEVLMHSTINIRSTIGLQRNMYNFYSSSLKRSISNNIRLINRLHRIMSNFYNSNTTMRISNNISLINGLKRKRSNFFISVIYIYPCQCFNLLAQPCYKARCILGIFASVASASASATLDPGRGTYPRATQGRKPWCMPGEWKVHSG